MLGGSYIELPDFIKNKKACVDIKNTAEKCFKWSILASKFYHTFKRGCGLKSTEYYKYEKELIEPENVTYPLDRKKKKRKEKKEKRKKKEKKNEILAKTQTTHKNNTLVKHWFHY